MRVDHRLNPIFDFSTVAVVSTGSDITILSISPTL